MVCGSDLAAHVSFVPKTEPNRIRQSGVAAFCLVYQDDILFLVSVVGTGRVIYSTRLIFCFFD